MRALLHGLFAALLALPALARAADADVIINELMYHPPEGRDDWQWIELFNRGTESVDLSGWSFKKGVVFEFPPGTSLEGGGFLVVARDVKVFTTFE